MDALGGQQTKLTDKRQVFHTSSHLWKKTNRDLKIEGGEREG